jgi:hypothetical protein
MILKEYSIKIMNIQTIYLKYFHNQIQSMIFKFLNKL